MASVAEGNAASAAKVPMKTPSCSASNRRANAGARGSSEGRSSEAEPQTASLATVSALPRCAGRDVVTDEKLDSWASNCGGHDV